ncbi:hypothetical protein BU15DRAFT_63587 [Melanogaster broomeanus]|nr:hypothetical protein BU15DRAFT_63587 [Melanogaster broomeanus]
MERTSSEGVVISNGCSHKRIFGDTKRIRSREMFWCLRPIRDVFIDVKRNGECRCVDTLRTGSGEVSRSRGVTHGTLIPTTVDTDVSRGETFKTRASAKERCTGRVRTRGFFIVIVFEYDMVSASSSSRRDGGCRLSDRRGRRGSGYSFAKTDEGKEISFKKLSDISSDGANILCTVVTKLTEDRDEFFYLSFRGTGNRLALGKFMGLSDCGRAVGGLRGARRQFTVVEASLGGVRRTSLRDRPRGEWFWSRLIKRGGSSSTSSGIDNKIFCKSRSGSESAFVGQSRVGGLQGRRSMDLYQASKSKHRGFINLHRVEFFASGVVSRAFKARRAGSGLRAFEASGGVGDRFHGLSGRVKVEKREITPFLRQLVFHDQYLNQILK